MYHRTLIQQGTDTLMLEDNWLLLLEQCLIWLLSPKSSCNIMDIHLLSRHQECMKVLRLEQFFHINEQFLSIINKFCLDFLTYRHLLKYLILLDNSILVQFYIQLNIHRHFCYCHHRIQVRIFFHHHISQRNNWHWCLRMWLTKVGIHLYRSCMRNLKCNLNNMLNMVSMKLHFDTNLWDIVCLLYTSHFWKLMWHQSILNIDWRLVLNMCHSLNDKLNILSRFCRIRIGMSK